MVTHSVLARYKDHCCGTPPTGEDAIMASTTNHPPNQGRLVSSVFKEAFCCCLNAIDCLKLELDGFGVKFRLRTSSLASCQQQELSLHN